MGFPRGLAGDESIQTIEMQDYEKYVMDKYGNALCHKWVKAYPGLLCGNELIVIHTEVDVTRGGTAHNGSI